MKNLLLVMLLSASPAIAKMVSKPVGYELGATKFEGVLLFDDAVKTPRPGLLLVPNWMGINASNLKQAEELAGQKYVVFVADMFGKAVRPKDMAEAGKAATAVKGDRKLMRERINKALEILLAQAKGAPLEATKVGAVGFCFGGTSVLELARSGAKVSAVVSIHGGLDTPNVEDAKAITAKVLALHGADDPNVPPEQVSAFENEMRNAKVDWQLVAFGNAVHSFTDPEAKMPGQAMYNPTVARRAYKMAHEFFAEAFGG
jgi:dienelactone hydrolase